MRKILLALVSLSTVGLLVASTSVSAVVYEQTVLAEDAVGDVPFLWDGKTGEEWTQGNEGMPITKCGYVDMIGYSLSQRVDTDTGEDVYTFSMEVNGDLLQVLARTFWMTGERKYLDFAAIADVQSLKRQIHAVKGHGEIKVRGHNLKLGRGGIRDFSSYRAHFGAGLIRGRGRGRRLR